MSVESSGGTLKGLASKRRERDRPTHVHVVGDFETNPPRGHAVASDVAHLLADDGRVVQEDEFAALDDGDVAFVSVKDQATARQESSNELHQLASLSRVKMLGGIVALTEVMDRRLERVMNARVWAQTGDVKRVERLEQRHPWGEVYAIVLGGLTPAEGGKDDFREIKPP